MFAGFQQLDNESKMNAVTYAFLNDGDLEVYGVYTAFAEPSDDDTEYIITLVFANKKGKHVTYRTSFDNTVIENSNVTHLISLIENDLKNK